LLRSDPWSAPASCICWNYYRPFDAAARGELDYDNDNGRNRLGLVAAFFDQQLAYRHTEQAELWKQLHAFEQQGRVMQAARAKLCALPLSEEQAANPDLQKLFRNRVEGAQFELSDIERAWRSATDTRLTEVKTLLANISA